MAGAQCGLLPEQVLSMSLEHFKAVMQGYAEHLFDLKCLTVYAGYWAGYYSNSKRAKPVATILEELNQAHRKRKHKRKTGTVPDVDVEAFLEQERRFNERRKGR